ncbi:MAG: hypothetical protein PF689_06985 [Deltaproteobacteria bacterium]|jgi:hypothetical protein|nr:hypothetical protein [Deltaproteobacteria bacterium]
MRNIFILFLLTGFIQSCDTSPQIEGSSSFVIGQKITVELKKGEDLTANQFKIIDAMGNLFPSSNEFLEYQYLEKNKFSFRIPPGIANGDAVLEVGSKDGSYSLDIHIHRGIAYVDGSGMLKMISKGYPDKVLREVSVDSGDVKLKIINKKSDIITLSLTTGRIDWLILDTEKTSSFGLKVPSTKIETDTEGVNAIPSDVVGVEKGLVIATNKGLGGLAIRSAGSGTDVLFDSWISNIASFTAVDISTPDDEVQTKILVAVGGSNQNESVMVAMDADSLPRSTTIKKSWILSADDSSVSDVCISVDGNLAAAVIPNSNTLSLVNISESSSEPVPSTLSECQMPLEVFFVDSNQKVAVLCEGNYAVQFFTISGTTANPGNLLTVGNAENKPRTMYYSDESKLLYIASDLGIQFIDTSSSNPSVQTIPGTESLNLTSFVVQP